MCVGGLCMNIYIVECVSLCVNENVYSFIFLLCVCM